MNTPNMLIINKLKKELNVLVVQNNYNLLAPDVLQLSRLLDELMLPLFEDQLASTFFEFC
ncbi:hypothetical protein CS063_07695 [Sporanaerobium hydrogeniformans]|uniref:Uncharacterized protein n=1 Tax=Sporanaerobium hydrogeniformans TaxID=3072179 RepID=A0AC61DDQ0_9FIRM|nr:Spo0E family sporulation regulatory protein-aspartic acid phosphatase [Sporanaerobium hydrogeniformans]PHV70898.1 hypothetical protein CS063_07695 [Sporanaerobium hydrogeniformans]